eukprot:SAG25_NODE_511_length_7294_cov_181.757192_12_plen_32_part_01
MKSSHDIHDWLSVKSKRSGLIDSDSATAVRSR